MSSSLILQQAAPLRQQVLDVMRREIAENVFQPGERLQETKLCDRYGVSRTLIREVLRQLESERLVTVIPNRGPVVTSLTVDDVRQLYQVRAALEGLMGELYARNATEAQARELIKHVENMKTEYLDGTIQSRDAAKQRFYDLLNEGAANEVLWMTLASMHARIGILRHCAYMAYEKVLISYAEIQEIAEAAAVNRDPERAKKACESHVRRLGELAVFEYNNPASV